MISEKINYLNHFEDTLNNFFKQIDFPSKKLQEAFQYCLFSGGKRIRPLLVYLTGELINLNRKIQDPIAIAIELIHTYSLIHDDLPAMDDDDLRRGKPSCHRQFDEATAILIGDGLQPLAIEILIDALSPNLSSKKIITIINTLVKASGFYGMVSGQSLDLNLTKDNFIKNSELTTILNLKTGKLILASVQMVIHAGDIPDKQSEALNNFAIHFGIFFQLLDDYLDKYKIDKHGKGRSSDLANNKTTFATKLSQNELIKVINNNYLLARDALKLFDNKAKPLITLLDNIHNRL